MGLDMGLHRRFRLSDKVSVEPKVSRVRAVLGDRGYINDNEVCYWRKFNALHKYFSDNFNEYKKKIQYELETYKYNGAIDFLLLEEDYKSALKKQGVSYGYSRGSVSGSIIAYLLGITEVDSIKYNLNFER
jgi:DNA polymerase III alpha subunit